MPANLKNRIRATPGLPVGGPDRLGEVWNGKVLFCFMACKWMNRPSSKRSSGKQFQDQGYSRSGMRKFAHFHLIGFKYNGFWKRDGTSLPDRAIFDRRLWSYIYPFPL